MDREERRRILGDEVIAHIHARVAEAPEPSPEVVEELRRIFAPVVRRLVAAEQAVRANQMHGSPAPDTPDLHSEGSSRPTY
jgi:hypothetical protein